MKNSWNKSFTHMSISSWTMAWSQCARLIVQEIFGIISIIFSTRLFEYLQVFAFVSNLLNKKSTERGECANIFTILKSVHIALKMNGKGYKIIMNYQNIEDKEMDTMQMQCIYRDSFIDFSCVGLENIFINIVMNSVDSYFTVWCKVLHCI